MCEPKRLSLGMAEQGAENATTRGKSFLQGLKPVESEHSTSELKLRPPKAKALYAGLRPDAVERAITPG
jgi:hypothetical protein